MLAQSRALEGGGGNEGIVKVDLGVVVEHRGVAGHGQEGSAESSKKLAEARERAQPSRIIHQVVRMIRQLQRQQQFVKGSRCSWVYAVEDRVNKQS